MDKSEQIKRLHHNLARLGVFDGMVLDSFFSVPREEFVDPKYSDVAYVDSPLPIGFGQTISQPSLVAFMTQELNLNKNCKVLEIGTGCGYQTALLSKLAKEVYTIEVVQQLSFGAQERLRRLGYDNVHFRIGNGNLGWPEQEPFDRILVAASAPEVPPALLAQLKHNGLMIIPVHDELRLISKTEKGFDQRQLLPVRFVPLVG